MTPYLASAVVAFAKADHPFIAPENVSGPWWQQLPPSNTFPYCSFIIIGAGALDWYTDQSSLEQVRLRFSIFHTNNNLAFTYANQIATKFTNAKLTLDRGLCVGCLPVAMPYALPVPATEKNSDGSPVYHVATDFRLWLA